MKTITTTVFEYAELSDAAKAKARDWYRECSAGDNYFGECVIEDAVQVAPLMGITIATRRGTKSEPCIFWSGFSSQGDVACFEGSWKASDVKPGGIAAHVGDSPSCRELKRIAKWLESIAIEYPQASFTVKPCGHYSNSHSTSFDFDFGDYGDNESAMASDLTQVCSDLKEAARDFMDWIYRSLEREYDYNNSDEAVAETIITNGYTFTGEGEREG